MAVVWKQKEPAKRWGYVFYEESREAPARDWLADLPSKIRQTMLDTLDAVLYTKNPPGAYLPNRWHSMKDAAGIDMGAYFEARDQHGEANYRLFCRFDSGAETTLGAPVLVLLDGASKPVRTRIETAIYQRVQALWLRYNHPERRCSNLSFPPVRVDSSP